MAQIIPLVDPDDYQTCSENNDSENCSYISMDDECSSISNPDDRSGKDRRETYPKNRQRNSSNQLSKDISIPRNHEESPRPIILTLQDPYMQNAEGGEDIIDSDETETNNDSEPSDCFLFLFVLISFGYMLPWTALGSLISYYKARYGASFYVKLYCAYYLPGLPFALLQYKYDTYVDSIFSSKYTYLFRGLLSYVIVIGVLVTMIFSPSEKMLILLFSLLGAAAFYLPRTFLYSHDHGDFDVHDFILKFQVCVPGFVTVLLQYWHRCILALPLQICKQVRINLFSQDHLLLVTLHLTRSLRYLL